MKKVLFLLIILIIACSEKKNEVKLSNLNSGSSSSFRGLAVLNENNIWVTGSSGAVLKTTNGGNNWDDVSPVGYEKTGFRDIHVWKKNEALIMGIGSPAIFLKTIDGGKSWQEVYKNSNPKIFFDSIEFWNDSCGIAFSDPVTDYHYIIKTTDYGNSWYEIDSVKIPKSQIGEAAFAASGTCIAVENDSLAWIATGGTYSRVLKSEDQGLSWEFFETPIISGLSTTGIYSVTFRNSTGFIVGGDYTRDRELNANAAISTDFGKSWKLLENKPQGFKSCVSFIPERENGVFVTGTSGSDISYDLGKNWTQIDTTSFNTIKFATPNLGYLIGDKGKIYKIELTGN